MKKILALFISLMLLTGVLCACAASGTKPADDNKLSIVCTIFPEYDWTKEILGDDPANATLTLLLDNGVDLHSYQPSAGDMIKISTCDLFIYVGGESDIWVEDALKEAANKDMAVIDLLEVLGEQAKEEELKEGMEGESEAEEAEYDEHVWLSLKNAKLFCSVIAEKLCEIDPANAQAYTANAKAYTDKLAALDAQYQSAVDEAALDTLIFADRFPFRYLVDDYGINYYAAFAGCSAETEASFETIAFLAGKADELGVGSVLTLEGAQHDIANTVVENTKAKTQSVLALDSMQSTTPEDANGGVSYLSIMQKNLDTLKNALN